MYSVQYNVQCTIPKIMHIISKIVFVQDSRWALLLRRYSYRFRDKINGIGYIVTVTEAYKFVLVTSSPLLRVQQPREGPPQKQQPRKKLPQEQQPREDQQPRERRAAMAADAM
jgi:hypothetical protein